MNVAQVANLRVQMSLLRNIIHHLRFADTRSVKNAFKGVRNQVVVKDIIMQVMRNRWVHVFIAAFIIVAAALVLRSGAVYAQLNDCELIDQNGSIDASAIGGCIAKTLQLQIGAGHGDENTFASAVYLIKRDPARSIRRGRQLFQRKFSEAEGLGPRHNESSTGDIVATRRLGAGLSDSCAACHGRPRGAAGFGGDVVSRPDSRDAPHLFGLGLVEMLADEMTTELRAIRDDAMAEAASDGTVTVPPTEGTPIQEGGSALYMPIVQSPRNGREGDVTGAATAENNLKLVRRPMVAKGVNFGFITVASNGTIDSSELDGVDADLRVRPFFHQGATVSIREFIIGAFKDEMGLEAWDPILCAVTDPTNPVAMTSPAGFAYDPTQDTYERPANCDATVDGDGDGVVNEIDPALVDHLEFYLLNYFKPGQYQVTRDARRGQRKMDEIGCTSCHIPDLVVNEDRRIADVETNYDLVNGGVFNQLYAVAETRLAEPVYDGNLYPQLLPNGEPFAVRNFYSDLKRHDLGPLFHEREWDGSRVTEFVTEPLWGVGSTAPYGHDGRSINLDQVIRRHGGEAESSKLAYARLDQNDQRDIIEFLQTLVLFPPDDTASNLNPGNRAGDPQNPADHGSINLGALFQIEEEGGE